MTLEEKAEECAKKSFCVAHTHEDELIFKNGYLEGAKENGVVWHDLRKDPNDLPKEDCEVIIKCLGEEEDTWKFFSAEGFPIKTIAWCEKPQFKE